MVRGTYLLIHWPGTWKKYDYKIIDKENWEREVSQIFLSHVNTHHKEPLCSRVKQCDNNIVVSQSFSPFILVFAQRAHAQSRYGESQLKKLNTSSTTWPPFHAGENNIACSISQNQRKMINPQ